MRKNLFIFTNVISTIVLLMTISMSMSCSQSSKIAAIAANQSNDANRRPMANPTPTNIDGKTAAEPLDFSKVLNVTYCELIKNPATYDRKIVRVRGIYFNGFERMFLYDEKCVKDEPPQAPKNIPAETWIQWDEEYGRKDLSEEAKLYRAVKSGEQRDVTVVGKFYGTRDINNTGSGKHQLRILRVEKILSVDNQ